MSKTKTRSKENIIGELHADEPNPYIWDIAIPFLEVLLDIRDILVRIAPTEHELNVKKEREDYYKEHGQFP